MNKKSFALFYRLHTFVGIFVSLHCMVLFLTGAILIFKDEIQALATPPASQVSSQVSLAVPSTSRPDIYNFILKQALQNHPTDRPLSLFPDEEDGRILHLRMGIDGTKMFRGARRLSFDAVTGAAQVAHAQDSGFFEWILQLHREIFLGSGGKLYIGFVGLLYLFTLISGFLIYGNFMKKSAYGEIRHRSARGLFSDIHRFVGVSVLAWSLLVGFTGMLLAFNGTLIKIYQYSELQKLNAQYLGAETLKRPLADLDAVIATAEKAKPDSKLSFVAFPDTQFSIPNHFIVLVKDDTEGFSQNVSELVIVDAYTAQLVEVRTLPVYLKMLMLSEPLHFGNYGGLVLKAVWFLFALISLLLPLSGLLIFYNRKLKSKRSLKPGPSLAKYADRNDSIFAFTKNPYAWPFGMIFLSAAALALPLLSLGYMPWPASLICALPAVLVAFVLIRRARRARKP